MQEWTPKNQNFLGGAYPQPPPEERAYDTWCAFSTQRASLSPHLQKSGSAPDGVSCLLISQRCSYNLDHQEGEYDIYNYSYNLSTGLTVM